MPPEPGRSRLRSRALQGVGEGAVWGGMIGLIRGLIRVFRGDASWYLEIGGHALAGIVVGAVICGIGRSISGKLFGAWIGAIIGLVAGLVLGEATGWYHWTTAREVDGALISTGLPAGQIVGSVIGALLGAATGATAERRISRTG